MSVNDGGPAFPSARTYIRFDPPPDDSLYGNRQETVVHVPGMSLRDWFAGQVIAGFYASDDALMRFSVDHAASTAYKQADALLQAREKENP
jgi:hypothetical protein